MRLIDADALIKDIAELIRLADEWEKESHKKKDKHGINCAIGTRKALLAMISRVKESPTIEPVKHARWIKCCNLMGEYFKCSECGYKAEVPTCMGEPIFTYCPNCGAKMDGGADDDSM